MHFGAPAEAGSRGADEAIQIAMLRAFECATGSEKAQDEEPASDNFLHGETASASGGGDPVTRIHGAKGVAAILAFDGAIEREPVERSAHADPAAFAELGCDADGAHWSIALCGRPRIRFGHLEGRKWFWGMPASLRTPRRAQQCDLLGARIAQRPRSIPQFVNSKGF